MSKSKHEAQQLDPRAQYVLKHRDRLAFVSLLTPVTETPKLKHAYVFEGRWLNETCWKFWGYWTAVEFSEAGKLYGVALPQVAEKHLRKKQRNIVGVKSITNSQRSKRVKR